MKKLVLIGLLGAGLSGCIAIDADAPRTTSEVDRLAKSCRERGGILVPLNVSPPSANEAANWGCEIRGASRLNQ